jgi:hypothetical protein
MKVRLCSRFEVLVEKMVRLGRKEANVRTNR